MLLNWITVNLSVTKYKNCIGFNKLYKKENQKTEIQIIAKNNAVKKLKMIKIKVLKNKITNISKKV